MPETNVENDDSPGRVRSGIALAIGGTFLFALKSIFIKLAYGVGVSPTALLVLRMTFALPFYLAMLVWLSRADDNVRVSGREIVYACLLGFFGYYLASWLDLTGLHYISAQLERLTLFTYPTMIAILAWMFLGESLNVRIISAIVISYIGVYVMYCGEQAIVLDSGTTVGVALVVGAALSYSLYVLFAKPAMQRMGSRRFTSLAMTGSTIFTVMHFAIAEPVSSITRLPVMVYVYGGVLALVCTVIPSFMINEAIVRLGATRTSVIGSVGPVLTMVLAIVVLQEPSTVRHFMGMALVLGGVSLVARTKSTQHHTSGKRALLES